MTTNPITALTRFFVESAKHVPLLSTAAWNTPQADKIRELAEALGVELGADGDTIEMAIRDKLTEQARKLPTGN